MKREAPSRSAPGIMRRGSDAGLSADTVQAEVDADARLPRRQWLQKIRERRDQTSATSPAPAWNATSNSIRKRACRATCARCWTTETGGGTRQHRRMAGMLDTLAQPVSHTLEVKHSRFIAHAAPIDGAPAALAFLQQVAVADATHNCWAYRHGGTTAPAMMASRQAPPGGRSSPRSTGRASIG